MVMLFRVVAWVVLYFFYLFSLIGIFTIVDERTRTTDVIAGLVTGVLLWVCLWFVGNVIEVHTSKP